MINKNFKLEHVFPLMNTGVNYCRYHKKQIDCFITCGYFMIPVNSGFFSKTPCCGYCFNAIDINKTEYDNKLVKKQTNK